MIKACIAVMVAVCVLEAGKVVNAMSSELAEEVRKAETAFASFLAAEAVFIGEEQVLRGKDAIKEGWSINFSADTAPFSWKLEDVEVLASGTLAHSSGPVLAPDGKQIGIYNSIWRLENDGIWKVVFDKGCSHLK